MATTKKPVKLILVTTDNKNKFYDMAVSPNDIFFQVSYGLAGGRATSAVYPIAEWNNKYNEKIKKGYVDQSHLFVEEDDKVN